MSLIVVCPGCSKRLKGKDSLLGKVVPCPYCGHKVLVARPAEDEAAAQLLQEEPAPEPPARPRERYTASPPEPEEPARPTPPLPTRPAVSLPPLRTQETPAWLRHLHWLLVLALVPLALSLLQKASEEDDPESRLIDTLKSATPQERERVARVVQALEKGEGSPDDLFDALPNGKLNGAFLPRHTWLHWAFGLGAAVLFLAFFLGLASDGSAQAKHLLGIGLFTATLGILFLFIVQWAADWTQGHWFVGRSILIVVFYLVKFIGFSYRAALDPENGFLLSFLGYTCGVGLCEEVCKALPLLVRYHSPTDQSWRGAFLWGLASGAAFGIAEGILYSSQDYNGVHGPGIYVVRFISCVALHAVWTGSVAITINQNRELLQAPEQWFEYFLPVLRVVAVPMVLHGLYDTLLKKELTAVALVVALASFAFLAFQISRLRGEDDAEATQAMLREYKKRRIVT